MQPDRDRRHEVRNRHVVDHAARAQPAARVVGSDKPPVIAAVRVPPSAWITSQSICSVRSPSAAKIEHSPQAASDQSLNLLRASALLAARRLAIRARMRRARQHAVLGGDPPLALALQERGNALLDAGGADDAGVAELDQHRAFGMLGEVAQQAHRTQFVGTTAARA